MSYLPNTFGQWSISNLRLEFPGSWAGGKNIEWRRMVYLLRDFSITDTSGVLTVREENNEMGKRKRKISVCWNSGTGELVNDWRKEGSEWNPGKWIKWQLKWENATFWCRDVVPTCDIYRYGELTTMDKYGPVIKKKIREREGEHEILRVAPCTKHTITLNQYLNCKKAAMSKAVAKLKKQASSQTQNSPLFLDNLSAESYWMAEIALASLYLFTYSCWFDSFMNEKRTVFTIMKCIYLFMPSFLENGKFIHSNNQREKYLS